MEFLALLGIGLLITLLVVPWIALSKANSVRYELDRVRYDLEQLEQRFNAANRSSPQRSEAAVSPAKAAEANVDVRPDIGPDVRSDVSRDVIEFAAAEAALNSALQEQALPPDPIQHSATNDLEILARAREFEAKARTQAEVHSTSHVTQPRDSGSEYTSLNEPVAQTVPSEFELQLRNWMGVAREWLFGGNLVAKVGLLILFIGVAFLVRLASNYVTVPIELRLAGVAAGAIALLVWAWRIRDSRRGIALPAQGAALAILMLVTFGAFKLFHVLPGGATFVLLFVLVAFTCILAVLQDAVWLAVFGISGGFAAPILTSTGGGSHIALFSYYSLLNAGVLAIALKRSWRMLNVLGFAFTFLVGAVWGEQRYVPENFASAQAFLIVFWLFYIAIAVVYAWRRAPELKSYVDGMIVFGVPMAGMALQYGLVKDIHFGMAMSSLVVALVYAVVASVLWRWRQGTLRLLVESFLALAIVFGTLAIPLALDGRWTSAAWALEGAAIVWVGLKQKQKLAWQFGVAVQLGSWIAFISALVGLDPVRALKQNVGLSFLLLGVTGVLLALMFRSTTKATADNESAGDSEEGSRQRFGWLASAFISVAVLWLLLGMWVEVWLRLHGAERATLLVATALVLVYGLQFLGKRSAWRLPVTLGNFVTAAAGIAFVGLIFKHIELRDLVVAGMHLPYTEPSLIELLRKGPLLGGLMLCAGALVSAFSFKQRAATTTDLEPARADKITMTWYLLAILWWSGFALHGLAETVAYLTSHDLNWRPWDRTWAEPKNGYRIAWYSISFWAAYGVGLAISALGWTILAVRKNFPHLRLMVFIVRPAMTAIGGLLFVGSVEYGLEWLSRSPSFPVGTLSDAFVNLIAGPLVGGLILCALAWHGAVTARASLATGADANAATRVQSLSALGWIVWLGIFWFGVIVDVFAQFGAHALHALSYPKSFWVGQWGYPNSGPGWQWEFTEPSLWWQLDYPQVALLLAAASAVGFTWLAKRKQLPELRWLMIPAVVLQAIASAALLFTLYFGYTLPTLKSVIALLGLWLGVAWCLRHWRRNEWSIASFSEKLLHFGRVIAPWVAIAPLVSLNTARWLQDNTQQPTDQWIVVGMWPDYLAAWISISTLLVLLRQASHAGWPLAPLHEWYHRKLIPLATAWGVLLVVYWNLRQDGAMVPLPYLPVLNPLDLTTGFVALLATSVWRSNRNSIDARFRALGIKTAMAFAFAWLNLMLLRTAAQYLDIPYRLTSLYQSQFVQAMLSIVWTLTAFLTMRYAVRSLSKPLWMVGAALLVAVVAKLALIDLSNAGSIARVVSFIGVGGLMVLIGYLAPFPRPKHEEQA